MDIAKAITFITEDPRWKEKMGMGLIVMADAEGRTKIEKKLDQLN